jgi:cardiolipin synthase
MCRHAQDPDHWRDTHFQIDGPVVAQMQAVFLDNWIKVTGVVLNGPDYSPELTFVAATRWRRCSAVPRDLTLQAMLEAMKRGVKPRIAVPAERRGHAQPH